MLLIPERIQEHLPNSYRKEKKLGWQNLIKEV